MTFVFLIGNTAGGVFLWQAERPRDFVCNNCGKSYMNKDSLYRHKNVECGKEPKFACPDCPYKTFHKYHLKSHIGIKHKRYDFVM